MINNIIITLIIFAFSLTPAIAQNFPSEKIDYILPFGPGGESDVTARFQQPVFKKLYHQDLVISYKSGGGGAVAWSQLNSLPGNGTKIMGVNLPHIIVKPLQGNVGFQTQDITPVHIFHYTPDAIVVKADSPFKTLADLISYAQENPKKLTFSGSGKGTANHLVKVKFDQLAAIKTTYVSFKGTNAAVTALLGEQVKAEWGYTTVAAKQRSKVRLLAIAMAQRHPTFPDVPTFKELGFEIVSGAYRGIAVPKSTPENIRQDISKSIRAVNGDPEYRQKMSNAGFAVVDIGYGPAIDLFMKQKKADYLSSAKEAGILK